MRFTSALVAVLLFVSSTAINAQSTNAAISGLIVDPFGKVISHAQIVIENDETGARYSTSTDDAGIYAVAVLPPGQYRIQISKSGFKTLIKPGIVLSVQSALALNFTLPVGATSESVTVEGGASELNTSDGSVSTVIGQEFVENMPLNGRSFQDLLTLAPGVAQVSSYGGAGEGSIGYSGDIVVNGQRTEGNNFTVDGVSTNLGAQAGSLGSGAGISGNLPVLTALGTTQGLASVDSLEEFRTTTSTYSAEFGRSPGGQFSFITRSGTNAMHGSAYDYFRNDALDANNWFNGYLDSPKEKERQNDFGGTLGGPITIPHLYHGANASFFFFSYEGLRLVSPQAPTQVEVPDAALRTTAPAALQPLLNAFPIGNHGSDGNGDDFDFFVNSLSYPARLDASSIRMDHRLGRRLSLFGRYAGTPSAQTSYTAAVENSTATSTHAVTAGMSALIRSNQSNDLRFNYTVSSADLLNRSTGIGGAVPLTLSSLPGPNGAAFPGKNSQFSGVFTFAEFTRLGLGELPSDQRQWNITDTHAWTIGSHTLKAGVDWRRLGAALPSLNPLEEVVYRTPAQAFSNTPALGIVEAFGGPEDNPIYINFSSFLEDEWKATPRLTLSAGIRWDINPAPGNARGPVPYTVDQVRDLQTLKIAPEGSPLWKTDWHGFAPRFGIAYQLHPTEARNTVLRGGFGIFYDTGNEDGSWGYGAIGSASENRFTNASFPLTSSQLTLPAPSVAAPYTETVVGFDPNLKLPYALEYTAAIEQTLTKRDAFTLSYVGSGSRRLLSTFLSYPAQIGNPNFASSTDLILTQGRASSGYSSLQAQYRGSIVNGLQALVSYTWSHAIDNASDNINTYYLHRGSSDFDVRQNLQAAISYLPEPLHRTFLARPLVNNWGFDLRLQSRGALPVDIVGNQTIDPASGNYLRYLPNLVPGEPLYLRSNTFPGKRIINFNAFASAPDGVEGDTPRNYARGFDLNQLDLAVHRKIRLGDRANLQFRAEAFNILNHANFGSIYNGLFDGPGLFGYAYATLNNSLGSLDSLYQSGGPRSLQLTLKVAF